MGTEETEAVVMVAEATAEDWEAGDWAEAEMAAAETAAAAAAEAETADGGRTAAALRCTAPSLRLPS
jgi:phage terminase large subunit-like protein